MYPYGYRYKFGSKSNGGVIPGTVPKVLSSIISSSQADGILVTWDRPMMMTCDAKAQIKVIIDGATEVSPDSIEFHPIDKTQMGLVMAIPFTAGQVVTWAYDDTGPCELQEIASPNTEADNQTYSAENNL